MQSSGNGPPKDVAPSALFLQLSEMPRPHKVVSLPRNGPDGNPLGEVAIWVLSQRETEIAQAEAGKYVRERLHAKGEQVQTDHAYHEVYNNELAVQLLQRAVRIADNVMVPFFPAPSNLRDKLTLDEVMVLYNE